MSDKLREALEKIAADSPPDDWETDSRLDGYLGYDGETKAESVDGVDESNMGDVHAHGVAVGLWMAAKIARTALADNGEYTFPGKVRVDATADAQPPCPTCHQFENPICSDIYHPQRHGHVYKDGVLQPTDAPENDQTIRAREQAGGLDNWANVLEAHEPGSSAKGILMLRAAAKTLRALATDAPPKEVMQNDSDVDTRQPGADMNGAPREPPKSASVQVGGPHPEERLPIYAPPKYSRWITLSCGCVHPAGVTMCPIHDVSSPPTDAAQLAAVKLLALKENWDSYGAPIISKIAVDAALQLRNVLATVPSFVPMSNGGVQIEWHSRGFDVELEIQPNGRLVHTEDAPGGPWEITDEMIRAALATELEDGPISQDVGFGMMRIILQNALNRLATKGETDG